MNLNPDLSRFAPPATNLVERLRFWSEKRAMQPAFLFLDEQDEVTQVTYFQLDRQARAIAAKLKSMGLQGERALLFYPPGLDFVAAFFGCLYAGTTAVPAFPPRRNRNMARVEAISEDAQAAVVLTVQDVLERSASILDDESAHLREIAWLATETIPQELADSWVESVLTDDTLAVMQYTSGSTGQPKGVMLTHQNLMHNCSIITHGFEADQKSVGLSWLPTYHDMGLVGGILNPLFIGRPNFFMAPMSFLQKPIRWLRNISRFKVTISGGPNFAYALCNEKISDADCEGLDLSRWTLAFNGAEPVRAETLAEFVDKFGPYGFRAEALYPCYGMAESTLIVSGSERALPPKVRTFDSNALESNLVLPVSETDPSARKLVSSGQVLPEQQVLIVDSETCKASPENQVGEIWVQSKSVAQGYWNNPEETDQVFHGVFAGENCESNQFLRTGDLGFFHEGQLFVTGRSKDLIIINGRNLYPHDFESIVETAHVAIRIGGGVAFSIDNENSEQLVIAQELVREYRKYDLDEITASIRKAVFEVLDVAPHSILLLKVGKLPKTSSGKVQRRACRKKFLLGELDILTQWPPNENTTAESTETDDQSATIVASTPAVHSFDSIQAWLVCRIANQLKTPQSKIDVNETFAHFGLDSITLIGISGELENWLGATVSPKLLFHYPTISELADYLATANVANSSNEPTMVETKESSVVESARTAGTNKLINVKPEKTVRELLAGLDDLSAAETTAMLKKLLQEKARHEIATHPLSHGQRALWFIYQMDPASAAYNIMYAARVRKDLDRPALCRSFQSILNRHEALRTTFSMRNGIPIQSVEPFQAFHLDVVDARCWSQDELDERIQTLADVPFDLEQGPVLRLHLLERAGDQHLLLFVVHHIVLDFWSFDLLFDELELFYREETTGAPSNLPATKANYFDFVNWQEKVVNDSEGERMWEYWQRELAGPLPVLDLPIDRPRPRMQSFQGSSYPFKFSDKLTQQLVELSKAQGVTLFATFLAAYQVMLFRFCDQKDVVVGCPTAGRARSEFEQVFGYFVNPIALRSQLSPNQSFKDFLHQVRETLVGGIMNQDYPFSVLVERLQTSRDASRSPVFQVAIGWDTPRKLNLNGTSESGSSQKPLEPGSMGLEPFMLGQQGSAFDVMLMLLHSADSVAGVFQYNVNLFEESTVARMAGHFQTLCQSIADNPQCSLGELPLVTETDKLRFIEAGNDTSADYATETCLHELFETQVDQTPSAVAVEFDGQQLTYYDLNKRANQVANHLIGLGVGPGALVAIYVDRSLELMIGLLGILKSGGAYVPLSPGTPRERLASMIDQCQTPVVLTRQNLAGDLPLSVGQMVCLDNDRRTIARNSANNPIRRAQPSNLAYVIFTSGSTGQPKGVQLEHRSVVNFLNSMRLEPGISSDDTLLAVTTITFDISVLELFLPLTVGAKVVIACSGIASDGIQLAIMIEDSRTTIMQATPATWRLLIESNWRGDTNLRVLCGGEALPPDLADALLLRSGALWNMYGPTETTIWSAIDHVETRSDPMPIGRPIANTQIHILDDSMQPVPRGVKGNLYIGGSGLARGYLGQPELTAESFVDDPFQIEKRKRLYKTGDLARHRADGKIEFLGRKDFQVKVRGFRIELTEIEVHLSAHPGIRQAVVTASGSSTRADDTRLVAYFTSTDEAPNTSDLRDLLKRTLPDYMVPSVFVPLVEFPLNSAGKIDRLGLPEPENSRPDLRIPYVAPRNEIETILVESWRRVLGLNKVGVHDNFFDLGGASMQSLEIAALLGESGIELLPAQLFQHPTIAELALNLTRQTHKFSENISEFAEDHQVPQDIATSTTSPISDASGKPKTRIANVVIESIGVYLPPNSVATEDVVAGCAHKVWFPLENMTGIKSRRVSAEDEFTSNLACHAVTECLENSKFTSEQIDLIICCHIGRDEQPDSAALEPGTAMYLKHRFEFPNAIAFDINNACAGMFTGVVVAESYIQSGAARRVLVVSAEHISPVMRTAQQEISGFIDPRIACLTLGDAGAAMILGAAPSQDVGFEELEMYSLTKYSSMCIGRPTDHAHGGPILTVPDPIKHTSIAIKNSISHSKLVLDRSKWSLDDIQWVILHQTSERSLLDGARAINKAFKRKICTQENTINNLSTRGNTASTSHFVAVWDNVLNGRIQSGDHVVFGITGSGQTIGTALYTFDDLPDRIRKRKAAGVTSDKAFGVDSTPIVMSNRQPRIRVESVGVVSAENNIAHETMPMVTAAIENCLETSSYDRAEIDLVLFAGVYRTDFISEPALATMIAGELKINDTVRPTDSQQTLAFDVINGSLGFLTACDIASQMMRCGKIQNALIIASDVENNRNKFPDELIGLKETASAIMLDMGSPTGEGWGGFVFKYISDHLDARKVTGHYTPVGPRIILEQTANVADHYLSAIPDAVDELLEREGISLAEIDIVLPPQFSSQFVSQLAQTLNIPRDRFVDIANEGKDWFTSSLPYSLHEIETRNLAKPGDIGLVINVAAGLQVGCAIYRF